MSLSGVGIQTLKDVNSLQLILGRLNWLNVEYRLKKHWRLPCFTLRRLDLRGLFSIEHSFLWWFPLDVFFSSKQNLKKTQFRYKRICHFFAFVRFPLWTLRSQPLLLCADSQYSQSPHWYDSSALATLDVDGLMIFWRQSVSPNLAVSFICVPKENHQ